MENAPVTLPSWKGTPRKECNKTKVKGSVLEGKGVKKEREREERKKKILSFHPAAWERSVFLAGQSGPMKWESQADLLSPRLYLVNHQRYKPVLRALWGRKRGRDRKKEWKKRLAEKIQAGRNKVWK